MYMELNVHLPKILSTGSILNLNQLKTRVCERECTSAQTYSSLQCTDKGVLLTFSLRETAWLKMPFNPMQTSASSTNQTSARGSTRTSLTLQAFNLRWWGAATSGAQEPPGTRPTTSTQRSPQVGNLTSLTYLGSAQHLARGNFRKTSYAVQPLLLQFPVQPRTLIQHLFWPHFENIFFAIWFTRFSRPLFRNLLSWGFTLTPFILYFSVWVAGCRDLVVGRSGKL